MTKENDFYKFDLELSDKEFQLIGQIVSQWGALEYEIFEQTLLAFDRPDGEEIVLPKEMNSLQASVILEQWKEHVVDKAEPKVAEVLREQYERISELKDYRDALVHGVWKWSPNDIGKINTVRIKKKKIIGVHFTADDLYDLYSRLAGINFKIRYPKGTEDYARERVAQGGYFSRRFLSMVTDNDIADDWLSPALSKSDKEKE